MGPPKGSWPTEWELLLIGRGHCTWAVQIELNDCENIEEHSTGWGRKGVGSRKNTWKGSILSKRIVWNSQREHFLKNGNRTSGRKNMMWGLRMENCQNKILGWAKLIRSNILHMGKVWFRETSNLYKVTEFISHRQSRDPTPAFQSSALWRVFACS